jgi:hypothetical protein
MADAGEVSETSHGCDLAAFRVESNAPGLFDTENAGQAEKLGDVDRTTTRCSGLNGKMRMGMPGANDAG